MGRDIDREFQPRPSSLDEGQQSRIVELQIRAAALAHAIYRLVPSSREQSTALTRLDEAVLWATSGVSRHPYTEENKGENGGKTD